MELDYPQKPGKFLSICLWLFHSQTIFSQVMWIKRWVAFCWCLLSLCFSCESFIIAFQLNAVASLTFNISFSFIWKLKNCDLHHALNASKPNFVGLKYRAVLAASAKCCRLLIWAKQPHWAWRPPSEGHKGCMLGASNTSRPAMASKLPLCCDWEVECGI